MKKLGVKELEKIANDLRKKTVTMIYEAQSGHPGGALSAADLVTALYFRDMRIDPQRPNWEETVSFSRRGMSARFSMQLSAH